MNRFFNSGVMVAIAATATIVSSCSSDSDVYNPNAIVEQYEKDWINQFGEIDPNQTWNTSESVTIDVTSDKAGTIKVYTASPLCNDVAPLITQSVNAGQTVSLPVAKPQSAERLYVVYYDANNYLVEQNIEAKADTKSIVTFSSSSNYAQARGGGF